jgi:hypothetical protein
VLLLHGRRSGRRRETHRQCLHGAIVNGHADANIDAAAGIERRQ